MSDRRRIKDSLITRPGVFISSEVLVCSGCSEPVRRFYGDFYACEHCKKVTRDVEWRRRRIV